MANEFKVKKGLVVDGSGTVLDVQGTQGQLFSVTDSLTGDLFSVSDISGIPILNVNSSGLVTVDGTVNSSGDITIDKDSGKLILQDTGTGNALNQWISYRDSAGTERAYMGYGSTGNSTFYVVNNLSDLMFYAGGVLNETKSGANSTFAGTISASGYNDTNWNTAYDKTLQWNGGSTGLVASTGRTSLGLGTAATTASTAYATSAQGTLATNALPKAGGVMSGKIGRSAHNVGFLEGSYNNVGGNALQSNPIYTIGGSYNPGTTTLSNMYGVGYSQSGASFITLTGATDWGFYVAADGDARVWLDGSSGNISHAGDLYVGGGDIILAGTGRIQGIDTVTAATDAASKAYVDGAVIANTDSQTLSISGHTISLVNGGSVVVPDNNTTYTAGSGLTLSGTVFKVKGGEIGAGVNLNTYRTTGYYAQNSNNDTTSGSNWPTNNAGTLTVVNDDYGNGLHTTQTYDVYNSASFYNRSYYNGTWSSWRDLSQDTNTVYTHPSGDGNLHVIATSTTNNGKVLTAGSTAGSLSWTAKTVNTDTTYSIGDGGLTQKNFTTTLKTKLDGIAASANNYTLPFTNNSTNWNTAYGWGSHAGLYLSLGGGTMSGDIDMGGNRITNGVFETQGGSSDDFVKGDGTLDSTAYTTNTGTLTDSNDRNYITDSRGAARAPSYYNDRYAQWDFQSSTDTGAGGDGWHGLLTVAKWTVYDGSHRQEQLLFTGNDLKRRTASSDSAWGTIKTIWDSGNLASPANLSSVNNFTNHQKITQSEPKMQLVSSSSPSLTAGMHTQVGGQLLGYGTNYPQIQGGSRNTSYDGGFFRIDVRSGYSSQFFTVQRVTGTNTETVLLAVNTSGDLTTTGQITELSDERLKSDVKTVDSALDKVNALRGVTFMKNGKRSLGVIAQEVEKVLPEVVVEGKEYKSVAYGNIVGVLIEAIKEQDQKIERLEKMVELMLKDK